MRFCHLCAFDRNDDTAERCRQCGADLEPLEDEEHDAEADSAWFHYLSIPNVGTIELVPGRAFKMGKEARNELVIPRAAGAEVATVFWTDDYDEATITADGTQDPVKIDGVKITGTRTLKGGEELTVGPLHMTYLRRATRVANAIDAEKAVARRPDPSAQIPDPTPAPGAPHRPRRVLASRASGAPRRVGAPPAAVCQALEVAKTSGTLRVQSDDSRGWITVVGGHPRHAAYGGKTGPDALLAILGLARARCTMTAGVSAKGAGQKLELSFGEAIARLARPPVPRQPTPAPRPAGVPRQPTPAPRPAGVPRQPTPAPRPAGVPRQPTPAPRPGAATPIPRPGAPTPRPAPGTGRTPPRPGGPPRPSGPSPGGGPPRRPPPP